MAERENELVAERENAALKKLQSLAGVAEKGRSERVDWMYEQSVAQKTDMELMNTPIADSAEKDNADLKALSTNTAGSLFLKGPATRTTEDTLRKLREDPLFQIRREEQAAKQSMLENPLIQARLAKKYEKAAKKHSKKEQKAMKKMAKKEKKAMKKAKKAAKKVSGGKASSSSSSSSDDAGGVGAAPARVPVISGLATKQRDRSRSGGRQGSKEKKEEVDIKSLGPNMEMIGRREEYAARVAQRKQQALESRGAPKRMDEEERKRRLEEMQKDAKSHDSFKNRRLADAEQREKEIEMKEAEMRAKSDQKYFKEMREQAYMEDNKSMAERLKGQRHRRQKGIVDSLERDDK